jgi:hypothetical protein
MHMWSCHRFDKDTPTSLCWWGRTHDHTWCNLRYFSPPLLGMACFIYFAWVNICSFNAISPIIMATSGYCVYSKWYAHFGRYNHYWSNSCKSCFTECFFLGNVCIAIQEKIASYCDQYLEDDFIPLIVEIFKYLHQQVEDFLQWCANMA